jgi:hypothetical protein
MKARPNSLHLRPPRHKIATRSNPVSANTVMHPFAIYAKKRYESPTQGCLVRFGVVQKRALSPSSRRLAESSDGPDIATIT